VCKSLIFEILTKKYKNDNSSTFLVKTALNEKTTVPHKPLELSDRELST